MQTHPLQVELSRCAVFQVIFRSLKYWLIQSQPVQFPRAISNALPLYYYFFQIVKEQILHDIAVIQKHSR